MRLQVMTYNVGVCLAVLCGFGLGHYLYADPRAPTARGEPCHGS